MDRITDIVKLNDAERELFQKAVNTLFTGSFIVRGIENENRLYRFVIENFSLFESYFECAGWNLRKDENLGIISWQGAPGARLNLNLDETLSLLVFRLLYEERRNDINLQEYPSIHLQDFIEMYKILTERLLKKTRLREIVRRFQALKLIKNTAEDTNSESLIILYPTIAFALDGQNLEDIHERIESLKKTDSSDISDSESATGEEDAASD